MPILIFVTDTLKFSFFWGDGWVVSVLKWQFLTPRYNMALSSII